MTAAKTSSGPSTPLAGSSIGSSPTRLAKRSQSPTNCPDEAKIRTGEIAELAREYNIVLQGPNCLGVVNNVDRIPLTFVSTACKSSKGTRKLAIVSQSGGMAAVLNVSLRSHGMGVSFSISTGNEACTGVEDYVEYLIEDEHTHAIAMIVEAFKNPRRFLDLLQRARACGKHFVLLHPGRTSAARQSAVTHTGAIAGEYQVMRTIVEHAGACVVETLEELIDVCQIVVLGPSLPKRGAAILTESGAFKALALDFCEMVGLQLPPLRDQTAERLRLALPKFVTVTNPLDITAQALVEPDLYTKIAPALLEDPAVGSLVLAIILTDDRTSTLKLPRIIDALRSMPSSKPIVFAAMDEGASIPATYVAQLRDLGIPFFPSPERALRALARLTEFSSRNERQQMSVNELTAKVTIPAGVVPEYTSKEILGSIGIPIPQGQIARTLDQAKHIAQSIGFPIAIKAQSAHLCHKTDAGGVVLDIREADALEIAWESLQRDTREFRPDVVLEGVLVERMAKPGTELMWAGATIPIGDQFC